MMSRTNSSDRSLVRASDLSTWAFCNRAWWLARVQGVPHRNPAQLERGKAHHAAVGDVVIATNRNARLGALLLLAGAGLALLAIIIWFFS
jgi:hypothetical protein